MNTEQALAIPPVVEYGNVSLSLRADLPESEWVRIGSKVIPITLASQWWVGDWLNFGIARYGKQRAYELCRQIAPDLADDTLYAYKRVAERFETCNRVTGLTWRHHQAVETLDNASQQLLLRQALANKYTVKQLKTLADQLKSNSPASPPEAKSKKPSLTGASISPQDRELLNELAAARYGDQKYRAQIIGEIVHDYLSANRTELGIEIERTRQERDHAAMETDAPLFA